MTRPISKNTYYVEVTRKSGFHIREYTVVVAKPNGDETFVVEDYNEIRELNTTLANMGGVRFNLSNNKHAYVLNPMPAPYKRDGSVKLSKAQVDALTRAIEYNYQNRTRKDDDNKTYISSSSVSRRNGQNVADYKTVYALVKWGLLTPVQDGTGYYEATELALSLHAQLGLPTYADWKQVQDVLTVASTQRFLTTKAYIDDATKRFKDYMRRNGVKSVVFNDVDYSLIPDKSTGSPEMSVIVLQITSDDVMARIYAKSILQGDKNPVVMTTNEFYMHLSVDAIASIGVLADMFCKWVKSQEV